MFYHLSKVLYRLLEKKFAPAIPADIARLFGGTGIDLEYVRYCGKVFSVGQIEELLNYDLSLPERVSAPTNNWVDPQTRMFHKNRLIQLRLMEDGNLTKLPLPGDDNTAGVYVKPDNLWNDGKPLFVPKIECTADQHYEELEEDEFYYVDDGHLDKVTEADQSE